MNIDRMHRKVEARRRQDPNGFRRDLESLRDRRAERLAAVRDASEWLITQVGLTIEELAEAHALGVFWELVGNFWLLFPVRFEDGVGLVVNPGPRHPMRADGPTTSALAARLKERGWHALGTQGPAILAAPPGDTWGGVEDAIKRHRDKDDG